MLPYVYEVFKHRIKNGLICLLLAWLSIQTFSLIYEVFEWLLTVVISGEAATDYNGQQGDIWDAQKDMALAMLGSSLVSIVYLYKQLKTQK
jgi:putative membrane protein